MFEEITQDTTSGASRIGRRAASALASAVEASDASDPGSLWDELIDRCRELLAAKREMAPVVNLVGGVLSSAERVVLSGRPTDVVRQAIITECSRVWQSGEALLEDLGREGTNLIDDGAVVATVSASESVGAVLATAMAERRDFEVLLSESRPGLEGVSLAGELTNLGVPTTLVADAALPGLVASSTIVLLGADSISESDFVNKIGSYALALAAGEADVPCYVAALEDKLVPEALRGELGREVEAPALLADAPPGLRVGNHIFEAVPLDLVRAIVTERGVLRAADVPARLRERPVPPALLQIMFSPPPPEH